MDARAGFFDAAYELRYSDRLDELSADYLEAQLSWFRENLTIPKKFSRSKQAHRQKQTTRGLSWYKHDAHEHISKSWELIEFLKIWGYGIDVLTTDHVGFILYEDKLQVVADPFNDTPR